MKNALGKVDIDQGTIDKIKAGQEVDNDTLYKLGTKFLSAAREHLGIVTLTVDFPTRIKKNLEITENISVIPKPMTTQQISYLKDLQFKFNFIDKLDACTLGLTGDPSHVEVQRLIAQVDQKLENKLREGNLTPQQAVIGRNGDNPFQTPELPSRGSNLTNNKSPSSGRSR